MVSDDGDNMNDKPDLLQEWLHQYQAVTVDRAALADPAAIAARLETLARTSAEKLPFDIDPTGFVRIFESLARGDEGDG